MENCTRVEDRVEHVFGDVLASSLLSRAFCACGAISAVFDGVQNVRIATHDREESS